MPRTSRSRSRARAADWRREARRTNLWLVPVLEALAAAGLFAITLGVDRAAYNGTVQLPSWVLSGSADGARQVLTTIAAAVITVVGLVFSITIVALTLASTQFGPRMLRNFIRDRGTQLTLGTFVATFLYAVLVLVAISPGPHGDFVPHLSITTTLALTLVDLATLIYFINHIARSIQLPQVVASIAHDLADAIEDQSALGATGTDAPERPERGLSPTELLDRMRTEGAVITTSASGYLQYLRHDRLVRIARDADAVIHVPYRPGHFLVQGHPLAYVWPPQAAAQVTATLRRGHVTGPYRTLTQDVSFGFDQLVEIGLRALSAAVNDTFTAITCIDWLGDCLCRITTTWQPQHVHRDHHGYVRVIAHQPDYDRLVRRSFEKIRQASVGMPAVMIRQLDALDKVMRQTQAPERRKLLMEQADLVLHTCEATVPEPSDRADVERSHQAVRTTYEQLG